MNNFWPDFAYKVRRFKNLYKRIQNIILFICQKMSIIEYSLILKKI